MAENKGIRHGKTPDVRADVSLKDAHVVRFEMDICTDDVCYHITASDGKLEVEPKEVEVKGSTEQKQEKESEPGE
jgi:hypothetical protein